jgi:hypothetical protein
VLIAGLLIFVVAINSSVHYYLARGAKAAKRPKSPPSVEDPDPATWSGHSRRGTRRAEKGRTFTFPRGPVIHFRRRGLCVRVVRRSDVPLRSACPQIMPSQDA